jgi:protoporphyrinogen oxidase
LGVICVTLILEQQVSPFYVTNITDSQIPFTGIIEMTALVDKKYFDGKTLVYLPKYLNPDDPLFMKSDAEITEYFISNFKKMYPKIEDSQILFCGVAKAKHVITVLNKGYTENLPNVSTSIPRLYIINSAHISDGTLNVNETITVAESKFEQLFNKQEN